MKKFGENKSAISPVIGVILMVALTVIMASVIAASVYLFKPAAKAPYAVIEIREAKGGTNTALGNNLIKLYHRGGDNLYENNTKIILTGNGYAYTGTMPSGSQQDIKITYYDLSGFNYGGTDGNKLGEIINGSSWDAGETILLYGHDGININSSITNKQGNTVDKKWKLKAGSIVSITIIDTITDQVIITLKTTVKQA